MTLLDAARLTTARALETGAWDGRLTRALSVGWNAMASRALCRPLQWPPGIRGITVGGATLGGSGKTPVAIALARAVAATGARVAFIAHGYRAHLRSARVVQPDDDMRDVGDEAIVAARALAGMATVVVARHRQDAIDFAATRADVMVVDGVLQSSPERAWMAVLALDGEAPWGSGQVVPAGDLRAEKGALAAQVDRVVIIAGRSPRRSSAGGRFGWAHPLSRGAFLSSPVSFPVSSTLSSTFHPWPSLAPLRLGLFTALARPSRLLAALARRGLTPVAHVSLPDHAAPSPGALARRLARTPVDLWLASPKCALHLEVAGVAHGRLEYDVTLDERLLLGLEVGRNDSRGMGAPVSYDASAVLPRATP